MTQNIVRIAQFPKQTPEELPTYVAIYPNRSSFEVRASDDGLELARKISQVVRGAYNLIVASEEYLERNAFSHLETVSFDEFNELKRQIRGAP